MHRKVRSLQRGWPALGCPQHFWRWHLGCQTYACCSCLHQSLPRPANNPQAVTHRAALAQDGLTWLPNNCNLAAPGLALSSIHLTCHHTRDHMYCLSKESKVTRALNTSAAFWGVQLAAYHAASGKPGQGCHSCHAVHHAVHAISIGPAFLVLRQAPCRQQSHLMLTRLGKHKAACRHRCTGYLLRHGAGSGGG